MLKSLKLLILGLVVGASLSSQAVDREQAAARYFASQDAQIECLVEIGLAAINSMSLMGRSGSQAAVTAATLAYGWVVGRWALGELERQIPGDQWGLRWASRFCLVGAVAAIIQSQLLA